MEELPPHLKETTDTRNERQASPRALKERLRVAGLQSPQRPIESAMLYQLAVSPALDHLSVMKDQDHVRVRDRAQAMRHRDRRSAGYEYSERTRLIEVQQNHLQIAWGICLSRYLCNIELLYKK